VEDSELDATGHAKAACEHIYGLNRATMWERDQTPAETAEPLADLAALAAALPQAFSQLSTLLEQSQETQILSMDSMTTESDPATAIGLARLHLDEARAYAVDLHKLLDSAHQATAHIISDGVDDGQESMPWDRP
jgi:hypothetical protein